MTGYLLFAGEDYYPNGGWKDFRGQYETENAAILAVATHVAKSEDVDWWHIVDVSTMKIIRTNRGLVCPSRPNLILASGTAHDYDDGVCIYCRQSELNHRA